MNAMTKIKLVTDSTCDLPDEILEKYNINVVPLSITIDGETYIDRVDIQPDEFLVKMRSSVELPKTSQPPVGQFVEMFDQLGADGSELLVITMTGGMSGTHASAASAASMSSSKVTVVDSKFISKALGYQVVKAAQLIEEGKTMQEILAELDQLRENTKLLLVVSTLDNLVKGGRIGKGKAFIGSLLNIKPISMLEDGVLAPVAKVRSNSQVVKYLVKSLKEDVSNKVLKEVSIAGANAPELIEGLVETIQKELNVKVTDIGMTTPVVSTHTGEGAIGFFYRWE